MQHSATSDPADALQYYRQIPPRDTYFLSQIRRLGDTYEIPVSNAERTLEREMARNDVKPESLYVVASLR
jgi:hypothetical protein